MRCGEGGNWASRLQCRTCGKPAASSTIEKAKKADKAARASEDADDRGGRKKGSGAKAAGGDRDSGDRKKRSSAWDNGPPGNANERRALRELADELAALKASIAEKSSEDSPSTSESEPEGPSIAKYVELAELQEEMFGKDHANALAARKAVAAARTKRDEGKPVSVRVREAEKLLERRERAADTASKALKTAQEAFDKAKEEADKADTTMLEAREALRIARATALKDKEILPDRTQLDVIRQVLEGGGSQLDRESAKEFFQKIVGALDTGEKTPEEVAPGRRKEPAGLAARSSCAEPAGVAAGSSGDNDMAVDASGVPDFDTLDEEQRAKLAEGMHATDWSCPDAQKRAWEAIQEVAKRRRV